MHRRPLEPVPEEDGGGEEDEEGRWTSVEAAAAAAAAAATSNGPGLAKRARRDSSSSSSPQDSSSAASSTVTAGAAQEEEEEEDDDEEEVSSRAEEKRGNGPSRCTTKAERPRPIMGGRARSGTSVVARQASHGSAYSGSSLMPPPPPPPLAAFLPAFMREPSDAADADALAEAAELNGDGDGEGAAGGVMAGGGPLAADEHDPAFVPRLAGRLRARRRYLQGSLAAELRRLIRYARLERAVGAVAPPEGVGLPEGWGEAAGVEVPPEQAAAGMVMALPAAVGGSRSRGGVGSQPPQQQWERVRRWAASADSATVELYRHLCQQQPQQPQRR